MQGVSESTQNLSTDSEACLTKCSRCIYDMMAGYAGGPMAWYGSDGTPYAILVPAAVAGALLPYLGRRPDARVAAFGTTLAFSLLSAGLTSLGLGLSFVAAVWAFTGILTLAEVRPLPSNRYTHTA